jgi:hypothetical protein
VFLKKNLVLLGALGLAVSLLGAAIFLGAAVLLGLAALALVRALDGLYGLAVNLSGAIFWSGTASGKAGGGCDNQGDECVFHTPAESTGYQGILQVVFGESLSNQ